MVNIPKKKLLFVMPGLAAGGGERSLVNLLSQIDYDCFEVDLFLFNHNGMFMEFLPKEVRIISLPETYRLFASPLPESIIHLLSKGKPTLAYNRVMFTVKNRTSRNLLISEQYNWRYVASSLERIDKKYDAAVGFLEKTSTYFCVDKVDALKKIGWVHIDYDKLDLDPDFDIKYFEQLDSIVTVSEECASVLQRRFPSQKQKVEVIYNIVSPKVINKMADQDVDVYDRKDGEIIVISIGRLHYQKYFEIAIEACRKLVDKGYQLRWNIIGEGEEREKLTGLIKRYGLEDNFRLLGLKSNPYPYIKQADIYAQTSRFEGKSIAIDEAKILNKPIVVTDFSTARDQITNGTDGLIVDMSPDAMADGLEKLINNADLKGRLVHNLSQMKLGTEEEIYKFYKLIK